MITPPGGKGGRGIEEGEMRKEEGEIRIGEDKRLG